MRDTESRYWEHMTPACMTEESDAENGEKIVTHQLLWRSECEFVYEREGEGKRERERGSACIHTCACACVYSIRKERKRREERER